MPTLTTALCAACLVLLAATIKVLRLPADMRYNLIVAPLRRAADLVDQPDGWQARHFAVAPFGGLLSTWLWVNYGPQWAQMDNFGVLFYGAAAVMLEGGYQMFYAISKRRRDINAAKDQARNEVLNALAAKLRAEPDADPMALISELLSKSQNPNPQ